MFNEIAAHCGSQRGTKGSVPSRRGPEAIGPFFRGERIKENGLRSGEQRATAYTLYETPDDELNKVGGLSATYNSQP